MEKTIKKWTPVLETLKVSEKNYEFFATYAEKLQKGRLSVEDNNQNLLPVNMKVLSLLDFDNIDIRLSETPFETIEFSEKIKKTELPSTDGAFELKLVQDTEEKLLLELSTFLNTKKEINIYKLVTQIGIREFDENYMEMFVQSRVSTK